MPVVLVYIQDKRVAKYYQLTVDLVFHKLLVNFGLRSSIKD